MSIHSEEIRESLDGLDEEIIKCVEVLDDAIGETTKYAALGSKYDKDTGIVTIEFEVLEDE